MYISMVALNSADSYEQHQAIWSLFPDMSEKKRDHLFRIEGEQGGKRLALLQSSSPPISSNKAQVLQSKSFELKLTNGEYFKFKLMANPTKRISQTKKVVELKNEAEQIIWLQRKLAGANVAVTSLDSKLTQNKKAFNSRFVTFEGILQITDAAQIQAVMVMGVGRKKHAGAGLLSLARAS